MNRTAAARLYVLVRRYFRLVVPERHPDSCQLAGVFAVAYRLRREGTLPPFARDELRVLLAWFEDRLPVPRPMRLRAICWFKGTRNSCSRRIWQLA